MFIQKKNGDVSNEMLFKFWPTVCDFGLGAIIETLKHCWINADRRRKRSATLTLKLLE